jgi:hypothetical protein
MITYSGNIQENKNNTAANNSSKEFVLPAQNKLQKSVNESPKIQQLKAYQAMADASSKTAQREAKTEEEMLQGKFNGIQREMKPEEEPVQGKFTVFQRQENNTGMPDNLKSGVEILSGMDMSDVKVHYNSDKPAQMQALAYAQGNDIHIGPGQEKHLPHEAWHVVQQRQGRVQPTMQLKGTAVNDDPGLEHEADVMGAKAVSEVTQAYSLKKKPGNLTSDSTIQRIVTTTDSVASDLMYDYNNGQTLFRDAGYRPFLRFSNYIDRQNQLLNRPYNHGIFMAGVRSRINSREIPVDYQRLSTETLLSGQGLITWLSSAHAEHMWINDGTIKVARRNAEKKPHPTLAGGDPDVTGAGLFTINTGAHTVTMNNRSGHFRPPAVDQASRDAVTTALTGTGYALT